MTFRSKHFWETNIPLKQKKHHLLGGEKLPPFRGRRLSPQLSVCLVEANQWEFPPKETERLGLEESKKVGIWLEKSL